MTAALADLKVVGLLRTDVAQTGTAAGDVNDDNGQFQSGDVADALLLQTDTQSGAGGHGALAGSGGTHNHVDGADFGLCLQKDAVQHGEKFGGGVCHFAGGGDGISEVAVASGDESTVDDCFVTFEHQRVAVSHDKLLRDFKNGDGARFGALIEARSATDASVGVLSCDGEIALLVQRVSDGEQFPGACLEASAAAFAFIKGDLHAKFFCSHLFYSPVVGNKFFT